MRSSIKQLIIISSFIAANIIGFVATNSVASAPTASAPAAQGITQNVMFNRLIEKQLRAQHNHVIVLAAQSTTTTSPAPALAPASSLYAEWSRVAICEEGGWIGSSGPAYPDSLGINATNWYAFGGSSDTSPAAQIAVAQRLVTTLGIAVPDQYGCAAW